MPSVAFITTSASSWTKNDGTVQPSGCWMEELATPFLAFKKAGFDCTIYSIKGGEIPFDAGSLSSDFFTAECKEFSDNEEYIGLTKTSKSIAGNKEAIAACDCVYVPGGHACFNDGFDANLCEVIMTAYAAGKVIGMDCHGPVCLVGPDLKKPDGTALIAGHECTAFSDEEEKAIGVLDNIPFSVEHKMKELGATFKCGPSWTPFVVVSGKLVTGQNPQSSAACAAACLKLLA